MQRLRWHRRFFGGPAQREAGTARSRLRNLTAWPQETSSLVVLWALSITATLFLTRYFGVDQFAAISHPAADGWCAPERLEGVGQHCFGDYSQIASYVGATNNPWNPALTSYPPASLLPFVFFEFIEESVQTSARAGLLSYLTVMFGGFVGAVYLVSRGASRGGRLLAWLTVGPLSVPALVALDRGNSVGLTILPLVLFVLGYRRKAPLMMVVGLVAAALIKPQLLLLALVFVFLRLWKFVFLAVGSFIGVHVASAFLLFRDSFPDNLGHALTTLLQFPAGQVKPDFLWPANQSLARGISYLGVGHMPWESAVIVSYALAILLVVLGSLLGPRLGRENLLLISIAVAFLGASSVAWSYYLLAAAGLVVYKFPRPARTLGDRQLGKRSSLFRGSKAVTLLVLASLSAVPLPFFYDRQTIFLSTLMFTPLVWVAVLAGVLFSGGLKLYKGFQKNGSGRS